MTDQNGHAERLGRLLLQGWPKTKDEATKVKAEVELTIKAAAEEKRLKTIDGLARDLRLLVAAKPYGYRDRISTAVEQLKELCK